MPRLTDRLVSNVKPTASRQQISDDLCPGLQLIVQPGGAKSWTVRYRRGNVMRRLALGRYPGVGLAEARQRAREVLAAVQRGDDPQADRREGDTIADLIDDFLESRRKLGRRSVEPTGRMLRLNCGEWLHRPAASITKRDVRELLERVAGRAPGTARRLAAHLKTMFVWAVATDRLAGDPSAGLPRPAAAQSRDRVLTDDELRAFWRGCDGLGYPFAPCFRLIALTAARRAEVGGMSWAEVDELAGLWTLPADRSKNGREHQVPLSTPARAIIAALPRHGPWLFTATGRGPVQSFDGPRGRIAMPEGAPPWRLHDLRRTAATRMAGLRIPPHVVEAVLNHVSGARSGVAGIYNRFNYLAEKREALEAWGEYVMRLVR